MYKKIFVTYEKNGYIQYNFWVDRVQLKNEFGRSHTTSQP